MDKKTKKNLIRVDGKTAIAFAIGAFETRHTTRPEWLWRYSIPSYTIDRDLNYIVDISWKPKNSRDPETFFRAKVDPITARTIVLVDIETIAYSASDLEEYK